MLLRFGCDGRVDGPTACAAQLPEGRRDRKRRDRERTCRDWRLSGRCTDHRLVIHNGTCQDPLAVRLRCETVSWWYWDDGVSFAEELPVSRDGTTSPRWT